jgi:hypothetical protein
LDRRLLQLFILPAEAAAEWALMVKPVERADLVAAPQERESMRQEIQELQILAAAAAVLDFEILQEKVRRRFPRPRLVLVAQAL